MAKHKGRRSRGRYIRGVVDEKLPLTALAAKDVTSTDFDNVVKDRTRISSLVAAYSMDGFTEGIDIGPIKVGVAHGDYSAAEIEEWIETTGSWDEGDKIQQEIAKRLIRTIGVFTWVDSTASGQVALANGVKIKTKLNWILNQGETLLLWAYNMGDAAVATTVPNVFCDGHANLWAL